ncbi:MAG: hypothetical protein H7Y07_03805, partial [Pyrinomonadaceae bacterium]|nr:hypothetical protein [Sphingobacteriaceae bacterium]
MNKQMLTMLDGISQKERLIPALNPDNIHISDKDLPDLLRYVTRISEYFNYYNLANRPDGNWAAFFKSDLHVLSILISKFDLPAHINHFFKLEMQLKRSINDGEMVEITAEIFAFVFDLSLQLNEILDNLKNAQSAELFPADDEIGNNLKEELLKLCHYNQEAHASFGKWFIPEHRFQNLGIRNRGEEIAPLLKNAKGTRKQTLILFNYLKSQFDSLGSKFNTLYGASVFYLNKSNPESVQYPPQIAMMMAFIELYSLLKSPLNKLTRNHLDLYYKQILDLKYQEATPDSIHIVFEAVPRVQEVTLFTGEELRGTIKHSKEQLIYALNEDVTVTHARINELKTIYVSEKQGDEAGELAVSENKEFRIYRADNSHNKRWAVMGEDPVNKAKEDTTMEAAELGLLIASPILYQPYGRREIELQIYLEKQSFDSLAAYFRDSNKKTEYNSDLAYRFLANAFIIHLTGPSGWFIPKKNKVSLDAVEKCVRVKIALEAIDEEIVIYNPLLHGMDHQIKWPAFKLMINNNAGRNALTFLRKMAMTRITVNAKVSGNHVLNLQNTNGPLSTSNPFQPFGPLAPVGSYLEIRNTNIFNRYTQNASVNLEWEGLPQIPGGWETYYRAYDTNIKNNSFKVKLSTEKAKRIKTTQADEFNLFETERNARGEEVLSDRTFLKDIDVKKWELTNNLLFNKDTLPAGKTVPDGVIRMELISPSDGFGHHAFSNIIPQVLLANAKWYGAKRELPQVPLSPVLRAISIDYELEETTILNNPPELDPLDLSLKLLHLYPFGFKEIYPLNINFEYLFFPDFNYDQNLFIGLTGILPGQELSILFELEEDGLSNTAKNSEPVKWSSLYNNEWFLLDDDYILNDSTNNFMNTGIVKILIPEQINTGNTIMSSSLYWLRAFKPSSREEGLKVTGVYLNAAS